MLGSRNWSSGRVVVVVVVVVVGSAKKLGFQLYVRVSFVPTGSSLFELPIRGPFTHQIWTTPSRALHRLIRK